MPPVEDVSFGYSDGTGLRRGPGKGGGTWGTWGGGLGGSQGPQRGSGEGTGGQRSAALVVCLLAATTLRLLSALALRSCGRPCSSCCACAWAAALHCTAQQSARIG